jgi:MFS family permease
VGLLEGAARSERRVGGRPMTAALALLREERGARRFFFAHTQSSLGTGAAYVALLVLAYQHFRSPWAVALILLSELLPATLLGPILGAAVDRFGRRRCAVAADALRALVFVALGLTSSFPLIVALALLGGVGSALFRPAILAGLPSMVDRRRLPAATSVYSAVNDLGHTLGPALAGGVLLVAGPGAVMLGNAITFAISAAIVASIDFGHAPAPPTNEPEPRSLLAETRAGLSLTMRMRAIRTLLIGSTIAVASVGMMNVGELQLAKLTLHAGDVGFSALVAISSVGMVAGSLAATGGGGSHLLKRRYLLGLLGMAVGMTAAGLAPVFGVAAAAFALNGGANGVAAAHEQLLVQRTAPEAALGRVFGVRWMLISGAFGISFLCGGALASLAGTRSLFLVAGAGLACAWAWSVHGLRREWTDECQLESAAAPSTRPAAASL